MWCECAWRDVTNITWVTAGLPGPLSLKATLPMVDISEARMWFRGRCLILTPGGLWSIYFSTQPCPPRQGSGSVAPPSTQPLAGRWSTVFCYLPATWLAFSLSWSPEWPSSHTFPRQATAGISPGPIWCRLWKPFPTLANQVAKSEKTIKKAQEGRLWGTDRARPGSQGALL